MYNRSWSHKTLDKFIFVSLYILANRAGHNRKAVNTLLHKCRSNCTATGCILQKKGKKRLVLNHLQLAFKCNKEKNKGRVITSRKLMLP